MVSDTGGYRLDELATISESLPTTRIIHFVGLDVRFMLLHNVILSQCFATSMHFLEPYCASNGITIVPGGTEFNEQTLSLPIIGQNQFQRPKLLYLDDPVSYSQHVERFSTALLDLGNDILARVYR